MSFITSWVTDKVSEYAKVGLQAGGSMAGNAVGGVGSMVENAGRTAGGGVAGGIGGVGSYINNYGESIKRSMSSDGPVSIAQKKTAVKPGGAQQAQKALTQGQAQKKALPAAGGAASKVGGAARGAGSTAQKTTSSAPRTAPSSATRSNAPRTAQANNSPRPAPSTAKKTPTNNANTGAANPRMGQQTNKVQNRTTDGKVKVSAASRPGYKKPAAPAGKPAGAGKGMDPKKHDAGDPLGMGGLGIGGQGGNGRK